MSGDRETGSLEPRQGKACWQKDGRERETPKKERGIGFTYHVDCFTLAVMQTCGLLNQCSMAGLLTFPWLILLLRMRCGCGGRFRVARCDFHFFRGCLSPRGVFSEIPGRFLFLAADRLSKPKARAETNYNRVTGKMKRFAYGTCFFSTRSDIFRYR